MQQLDTLFYNGNDVPIESWLDDDQVTVHQIDSETQELWFDLTLSDYQLLHLWILGS